MHDDLALDAADDMLFFPREVVMVLQIQQHRRTEMRRDVAMDARVVRRRVLAHQFHRGPIFLALLRIQREPCEPFQLARQIRELAECNLAVVIANRCARAAAAAVRQQRNVSSGWQMLRCPLIRPADTFSPHWGRRKG